MKWLECSKGLVVLVAGFLAACGVPKEAGLIAAQGAATSTTMPTEDADVRAELKSQAAMWAELSALLKKREFGGIMEVDSTFTTLVDQTAALAQRQADLINQNQDDAAHDRQALTDLHQLWQSANGVFESVSEWCDCFFMKGIFMSIGDDIVAAVAASTKLDAGTKSIVTEFLQAVSPAVGVLAPEVLKEVLAGFAGGDASGAVGALTSALSPEEVVAGLGTTEQEMGAEVSVRGAQVAAAKAMTGALESAALSILSRLVISAL